MKVIRLLILMSLVALLVYAADVTGKWQITSNFGGQTRTSTLTLKQDGETLTGSISGRAGETPIQDGKISGDDISFTVVRKMQDQEFKMNYKGKVSGDTIKLTVSTPRGEMEQEAKRVKE